MSSEKDESYIVKSLIVRNSFLFSFSLFVFVRMVEERQGFVRVRYSWLCSKRARWSGRRRNRVHRWYIVSELCTEDDTPSTSHVPFSSSIASRRNGHTYRYLTSINFRLDASYWVKELCKAFTVTNKLMAFGSRWLMSLEFTLAFVNGNSINARINKSVTRYPERR